MQATQHRSGAHPEAKELRKGHQQVDGKDEDFTHRPNRTITAGPCKTARRVRIASHYEFATHRLTSPMTSPRRRASTASMPPRMLDALCDPTISLTIWPPSCYGCLLCYSFLSNNRYSSFRNRYNTI